MKAVLISIHPKWCDLIAEGKKTVEVRKTKPKLETPFKCYIYCTKPYTGSTEDIFYIYLPPYDTPKQANGKVIGEFVCDRIDEIGFSPEMHGKYISNIEDLHKVSCVDFEEMFDYIADGYGYGWHISNLVIYGKPRGLSEFHKPCVDIEKCLNRAFRESGYSLNKCFDCGCRIKRPPQSWCYVEN